MPKRRDSSRSILAPAVIVLALCWVGIPAAAGAAAHDAVILEESLDIEIRSVTDARVRFLRRTEILTRRGVEMYGFASVFYGPGVRIKDINGAVIDPRGRRLAIKKRDIYDGAAFEGFVLYADTRHRTFQYRGLVPGATVEQEYELQVSNLHYLQDTFFLQEELPVRVKRLTIRTPPDFPLRVMIHGQGPVSSERVEDGILVRDWIVRDVEPMEIPPYAPPMADILPRVTFEPGQIVWGDRGIDSATWSGIADFYHSLAEDRLIAAPAVAVKARELTEGAEENDEKIRRIFEFVRGKVNYVAIALDIGGWQPHENGEVLRNLYGDCKDKSALMIAMLGAVDVEARPALLRTRDAGLIDRDNPELGFNHAIVAIPEDDGFTFMDPTAESVPYRDLPWQDQDVTALVVLGNGAGRLVQTPLVPAVSNGRRIRFDATLDSSGDLRGEITMEFRGQRRAFIIGVTESESRELLDRLAGIVQGVLPGASVSAPEILPPESWEEPVRLTAQVRIPGFVSRAGTTEVFHPDPVRLPHVMSLASESARELPLFLHYPFSEEVESRLRLPPGRHVAKLPEDFSAAGPGLQASSRYEIAVDGGAEVLITRRTVSVGRREYPAEEYPELRAFIRALQGEEARAVSLRTTRPPGSVAGAP